MSALERAFNLSFPYEIVLKYISLYKSVGESVKDTDLLGEHYSIYHEIVYKEDIKNLFEMYFKDYKMTSARMSSIIDKSGNTVYKNNDEKYLANLTNIFDMIYSDSTFDFLSTEIIDLELQLSSGIQKSKGLKRPNKNEKSYRERLDELIELYHKNLKSGKCEVQYLNVSFMVDFIKLSPFYEHNELIGLIILYVLMLKTDIKSFAYISFFKELKNKEEEFKSNLLKSFYMYDEGMTNISDLFKFILDIEVKSYKDLHYLSREIEQDKVIKKSSSVVTVIYKLPETFSKEDIRRMIPTVSDSTIDRVLKALQDEGKIMALGRGRGSKWLRLDDTYDSNQKFLDNFN